MEYSMEHATDDTNNIIKALEALRDGIKLYLLAVIIALAGIILILLLALGMIATALAGDPRELIGAAEAALGITLAVLLILLILALVALSLLSIIKIRKGMEDLEKYYRDVSIGALGAKLIFYGIILVIVGVLTILIIIGIIPLLIGGLMIIIGNILWAIGILNLNNHTKEDLSTPAIIYLIGAIIGIIGAIAPEIQFIAGILELIGLILLYIHLGNEIEHLKTQPITT